MIAFYKRMDHLVTVNPYFIDALQKYGVPREKITYIPNVVSEERFCPLPMQRRRKVRREYGLEEEKFTVLSVGQLQKRKGVMDFIRIAQSMPEIQFVWAGGFSFGKISDGYDEIRQALKDLPDNVRFLGMVERERMNDIYNMADVMFLASYEELFPMTILEAMNCGLPIVVRDLEIYQPILFDYVLKGNTDREFKILLKRLEHGDGLLHGGCSPVVCRAQILQQRACGTVVEAVLSEPCCREDGDKGGGKLKADEEENDGKKYTAFCMNAVTVLGLAGTAAFIIYGMNRQIFTSRESLQMFLDGFGIFAPVIFTAIQIVQGGSADPSGSDRMPGRCTHFWSFLGFCL